MAETVDANRLYKQRYGEWAGRPNGAAPDYKRCCVEIFPQGRGELHRQCSRPRGFGPDGAYCAAHDPEAVARRAEEATRKFNEKHNQQRVSWHGREFYNVLKQIAEGHNDARGLAQETLDKFHAGDR